jgi:hypothetical protein
MNLPSLVTVKGRHIGVTQSDQRHGPTAGSRGPEVKRAALDGRSVNTGNRLQPVRHSGPFSREAAVP